MTTSEKSPGKAYFKLFKNKKFRFEVGDPTFIAPDDEKPKSAIFKHITEDVDGELMVMCQYLYRLEDVADRYGRNPFYSFNQEEIPSVCLLHAYIVHFVSLVEKIPICTENPGFIVKVYDHEKQVLWWKKDMDFEKHKQMEEEKAKNSLEEGKIVDEEVENNISHIPLADTYDIDAILAKALTGDDARDKLLDVRIWKCISKKWELHFDLKNTVELAGRLIDCELKTSAVVEMTVEELRRGCLASEEKSAGTEPEEQLMDMVDIPCPRCNEKKVGLRSSIFIPGRAAGYQLECLKCGKTWFLSRM
ncbi:hypothetical protein MKW92_039710 [Papaver armeniacum]|nr:hypothetical protein MKW92_039710 [Papaver armeniacum]